jgi:molecular chaperone Hsp33
VPDIVIPRGITPFHLEGKPVRGRLVQLGPLADALLARHPYHPVVAKLAGQALALAALLASALKYQGSFSIQIRGDGPVPMLLADCTHDGALRAYAKTDQAKLDKLLAYDPEPLDAALLGIGHLAFTVDQGNVEDRYQGVVAIEGLSLAQMATSYFRQSEQLAVDIRLACGKTANGFRATGLMLERVADSPLTAALSAEEAEDAWITARTLAATLTPAEMLDDALDDTTLLWRLFGNEGVSVSRSRALAYGCRCSRARLANILDGFPAADLDHMSIDGNIVMTCEFCNYDFRFDRDSITGAAEQD